MYIDRTTKTLANAFLFFVEKGTISENGGTTITVDIDAKPDNTPTTNWLQRPCTLEFDIVHEYEEEKTKCPKATGGWITETDRNLIGTKLVFKDKVFTENLERLLWALPSKVVTNTAQIPFSNANPEIYGWMKVQQKNAAGANLVICDVWGKLILKGGTKLDGKITRPEYEFEVLASSLNAWVTEV